MNVLLGNAIDLDLHIFHFLDLGSKVCAPMLWNDPLILPDVEKLLIADVEEHPLCAEVVKKEHQKVLNFLTFIDYIHHNAVGMLGEFFIEIEKALLSQVPHTFV